MNAYQADLAASADTGVRDVLSTFYRMVWPDDSVLRIEYDDTGKFQRMGRDARVVLRAPRGTETMQTIEEKIRRPKQWPMTDLMIEILSNVELGTLGWAYTSSADWLVYVCQDLNGGGEIAMLPMQPFRLWFAAHAWRYDIPADASTPFTNGGGYHSRNRIVPLADPIFRAFRDANGLIRAMYWQGSEVQIV